MFAIRNLGANSARHASRLLATLIHHGSMDNVLPSIQALARWVDASGYQPLGYARELTLKLSEVRDDWVTELQEPITLK